MIKLSINVYSLGCWSIFLARHDTFFLTRVSSRDGNLGGGGERGRQNQKMESSFLPYMILFCPISK